MRVKDLQCLLTHYNPEQDVFVEVDGKLSDYLVEPFPKEKFIARDDDGLMKEIIEEDFNDLIESGFMPFKALILGKSQ